MKLRIEGNSLRLRLRRLEVSRLAEHGSVEEATPFRCGGILTYRIETGGPAVVAGLAAGCITVRIPPSQAVAWAASDEVGIYGRDGDLRIAVEKDFRCLTRPAEEEHADAYPHPAVPAAC
jgi:hypothetical protein